MSDKRILIVDDEHLARERLQRFIRESGLQAEVAEAHDGIQAVEKIQSFNPEILFLDIQMPGFNGFEVLQQIEKRDFQIIFQTAYDEYALKAFDESACDYLLKPFTMERFERAVQKALKVHGPSQALDNLEKRLQKDRNFLDRIAVRQANKTKIVEMNAVIYFISQDHYTCIHTETEEFISELSLNWLEERLNPEFFIRCHRNNIVALKAIKAIGASTAGEVELKNGVRLPLSRNNRKTVLEKFSH